MGGATVVTMTDLDEDDRGRGRARRATSEKADLTQEAERVSLAGPDPLDVLRAMLKVDPDVPPTEANEPERAAPDEP